MRRPWAGAVLFLVAACTDNPAIQPTAVRDVQAVVTSSYDDDAAVVVEFDGLDIVDVTIEDGFAFLEPGGVRSRAVLIQRDPGPIRFTLHVRDRRLPLRGRVVQAADGANRLRSDLRGYSLYFAQPQVVP